MKIQVLLSTLILSFSVFAQSPVNYDCSTGRFVDRDYFSQVTMTSNIEFGENGAVGTGTPQKLYMDIFEPTGDTELSERPIVILTFGGSFVGGNRTEVHPACEEFAKMGYVAVAIDYRVGFFLPTQNPTTMAVMRGMHDMKAAVRFFGKSYTEDGNPYKINPKAVIVGGFSAGAICALHTGFLRDDSEIPGWITATDTTGMGGAEGVSGNSGYSSEVVGILNFSGAIGDTTWIGINDYVPTFSVHDDGDNIVPYDTKEVLFGGSVPTGLIASGSLHVNDRMSAIGVPTQLVTFNRNAHVSYVNDVNEFDSVVDIARDFLVDNVICTWPTNVNQISNDSEQFELYPNPTHEKITIRLTKNEISNLQIFDLTGKVVVNEDFDSRGNVVSYDVNDLLPGIYFTKAFSTSGQEYAKKFVVE
jgi:hypothetical protein